MVSTSSRDPQHCPPHQQYHEATSPKYGTMAAAQNHIQPLGASGNAGKRRTLGTSIVRPSKIHG